jgi:ferric-dicitrate binding protein FerR (iron transport regulator)
MLASDSTPSFLLRRGTVIVDEKVVDPVRVAVPGGFVLVKGDPQAGAECEMANVENVATVTVRRGLAEIHSQGAPVILHAGQSARVEAGPDGSEQVAGRINKEIPSGLIQREGQTQELPLTLNEVINWNDLVRTLQAGRAQITLLDGSTLNVGARSTIKILKHDPQAQQTQIELLVGRVQANAQKITTPGGKFELHTKSAVIGTVDTSYVAESDDKGTRVCGVEGVTAVQGTDPNQPKKVYLHKNECAYVPFGGVPTDPVLNPGLTSALANATNIAGGIGGVAGVAGAAGGAAGVAGGFPWAWVAIGGVLASEAGASAAIVTTSNPSPTSPIRP